MYTTILSLINLNFASLGKNEGVIEMAQCLRAVTVLQEHLGPILSTHGGSQLAVTPVPRDPVLSCVL